MRIPATKRIELIVIKSLVNEMRVSIVVHGDYGCPDGRRPQEVHADVRDASGKSIRYVCRHLPLASKGQHQATRAIASEAEYAISRLPLAVLLSVVGRACANPTRCSLIAWPSSRKMESFPE
ncbi:MAG TPA: hypothetical protein DDW52_02840 [Planctomycetaceae bacterium]|nr:hypothetical protein [Planctomycetaceae bacterium]